MILRNYSSAWLKLNRYRIDHLNVPIMTKYVLDGN